MINYLQANGYRIVEEHRGHEHGIDIIAEKNNHTVYVELKGDSAAPDVDFGTMIYQIMKNMKPGSDNEYGLGVSEKYEKYAIRCRYPLEKLRIKVFIISDLSVRLLF